MIGISDGPWPNGSTSAQRAQWAHKCPRAHRTGWTGRTRTGGRNGRTGTGGQNGRPDWPDLNGRAEQAGGWLNRNARRNGWAGGAYAYSAFEGSHNSLIKDLGIDAPLAAGLACLGLAAPH